MHDHEHARAADIDLHLFDAGVAGSRSCSGRFVRGNDGIHHEGRSRFELESEAETPGHDSCAMRPMDGDSSLRLLLGL